MSTHEQHAVQIRLLTPEDQSFIDRCNVRATFYDADQFALPAYSSLLVGIPLFVRTLTNLVRARNMLGCWQLWRAEMPAQCRGREYTHEAGHQLGGFPFELIMGVEGGFQGRGIGRLLLRSFIDLVKSAETEDTISLEVHKNNAQAKKLYESVGFQYLTNTKGILEDEYGF